MHDQVSCHLISHKIYKTGIYDRKREISRVPYRRRGLGNMMGATSLARGLYSPPALIRRRLGLISTPVLGHLYWWAVDLKISMTLMLIQMKMAVAIDVNMRHLETML